MIKRSITGLIIGVVFAAVVICSLKLHYIFFDIFCLALMIMGALEVGRAVKKQYSAPFATVVVAACVLGYITFFIVNKMTGDLLASVTAFLMIIACAVLVSMICFNLIKEKTIENAISTLFCLFYPCALMIFMVGLNYLDPPYRAISLIMLFTVTPLTDVMAYLVGSTLKGKKLCPSISPKKTISGAVGGLFGGLLGGGFIILITQNSAFSWLDIGGVIGTGNSTNIAHCLILGFCGSVCTQAGDILASYVKRRCQIKDYGNLLPGHGGVMDRIDGMIINAVFLFLYMSVLSIVW